MTNLPQSQPNNPLVAPPRRDNLPGVTPLPLKRSPKPSDVVAGICLAGLLVMGALTILLWYTIPALAFVPLFLALVCLAGCAVVASLPSNRRNVPIPQADCPCGWRSSVSAIFSELRATDVTNHLLSHQVRR